MNTSRRFLTLAFAGLAALALGSPTRADFHIDVYVNGIYIDTITPSSGLALPSSTPSVINVNTTLLNQEIAGFAGTPYLTFNNLTATSNQPTATGMQNANIGVNGDVVQVGPNPTSVVQIVVSSTDFAAPQVLGTLSSSASDTFTNFGAGDGRTFQSYYDGSNTGQPSPLPPNFPVTPPPAGPTTGLQAFVPLGPGTVFSTAGTRSVFIGSVVPPFALVNDTFLTIGTNPNGVVSDDRFAGTTTLSAVVPEPASMALVLLGFSAVGLGSMHHRRKARVIA